MEIEYCSNPQVTEKKNNRKCVSIKIITFKQHFFFLAGAFLSNIT